MGVTSLSPPALSLDGLLQEEKRVQNYLFVTTPGADPSTELEEFAKERLGDNNLFRQLAMGGGQNDE